MSELDSVARAPAVRQRSRMATMAGSRLGVALACGAVVAIYMAVSYTLRLPPGEANDFTVHWYAARALLAGEDPYHSLYVGGKPIYMGLYFYPLPATLIVAPIAWLPIKVAAIAFESIGATLLAYYLAVPERWRLAALLSAPMLSTAAAGQNTSFVTLAALTPALGWLVAVKPNIGLAIVAMRPTKATILGGLAFAVVSLTILATWPREWLNAVKADPGYHAIPVGVPGGIVLLLAVSRWRRPEARLLVVLSCVPHTMTWYDALPLMLIPATFRQLLVLAILSHLASFVAAPMTLYMDGPDLFRATAKVALWGLYVPALLMLLRRPNHGAVPAWVERRIERWPAWLKGASGPSTVPSHPGEARA